MSWPYLQLPDLCLVYEVLVFALKFPEEIKLH